MLHTRKIYSMKNVLKVTERCYLSSVLNLQLHVISHQDVVPGVTLRWNISRILDDI